MPLAHETSPHDEGSEAFDLLPIQYWPCRQRSWMWVLGSGMARLVVLHAWDSAFAREMVSSLVIRRRILLNPFFFRYRGKLPALKPMDSRSVNRDGFFSTDVRTILQIAMLSFLLGLEIQTCSK